jgi:hypothetical protein
MSGGKVGGALFGKVKGAVEEQMGAALRAQYYGTKME